MPQKNFKHPLRNSVSINVETEGQNKGKFIGAEHIEPNGQIEYFASTWDNFGSITQYGNDKYGHGSGYIGNTSNETIDYYGKSGNRYHGSLNRCLKYNPETKQLYTTGEGNYAHVGADNQPLYKFIKETKQTTSASEIVKKVKGWSANENMTFFVNGEQVDSHEFKRQFINAELKSGLGVEAITELKKINEQMKINSVATSNTEHPYNPKTPTRLEEMLKNGISKEEFEELQNFVKEAKKKNKTFSVNL